MKEVLIVKSIEIDRPLEEVFEFISDYSNDPKWRNEAVEMAREVKNPEFLGDRIYGKVKYGRKATDTEGKIVEYERNKNISFEVTKGPVYARGTRLVRKSGSLTNIVYSVTFRLTGWRELISWYLVRVLTATVEENLFNLKKLLESGGAKH